MVNRADDRADVADNPPSTTTRQSARLEIVVDDTLLDASTDPPTLIRKLPGLSAPPDAHQPPTRTPSGLIAAIRPHDGVVTLVQFPNGGGEPKVLANDVLAFAVNFDGTEVAYSQADQLPAGVAASTSTLAVAQLPAGAVRARTTFSGFLSSNGSSRPIGWAGSVVLLDTGDGAGSTAAKWTPGSPNVDPPFFLGTVAATDPERP
jgi:hypothetical protein